MTSAVKPLNVLRKRVDPETLSYINPKITLKRKGADSKGLFAVRKIKKGEIVSISAGIALPLRLVKQLPKDVQRFCYYVENGFFFCPLTGSPSGDWFMNHSCRPHVSAPTEAFTLRAIRDILPGEEILYDYGEDYLYWKYRPFRRFRCSCGAPNCRQIIRY